MDCTSYLIYQEVNNQLLVLLFLVGSINIYAIYLMALDKVKAVNNSQRIPEGVLFFWAVCFGSLGVFFGMVLFRHKRRKWYFYFGVPLAMVGNISFIILLIQVLNSIAIS